MTLSKIDPSRNPRDRSHLEAAVVTLRPHERFQLGNAFSAGGELATPSSFIKSTLPEKPISVKTNFHLRAGIFFPLNIFIKETIKLFGFVFPLFSDRKRDTSLARSNCDFGLVFFKFILSQF